jgi:hypothetical protein
MVRAVDGDPLAGFAGLCVDQDVEVLALLW